MRRRKVQVTFILDTSAEDAAIDHEVQELIDRTALRTAFARRGLRIAASRVVYVGDLNAEQSLRKEDFES
jgi:hypothetical protein